MVEFAGGWHGERFGKILNEEENVEPVNVRSREKSETK